MDFRRIFKPKYVPTPLSFAVRRSEHHSPEGLVTLEENGTPATWRHSRGHPRFCRMLFRSLILL